MIEKVIRKYHLTSELQAKDDRSFWQLRTIKEKLETVETLREDAVKLGIYPDYDENKQGLRRVFRITKQK